MLVFDGEDGEFKNVVVQDQDMYIISVFTKDEDWKELENSVPYTYDSLTGLQKGLKKDTSELTDYLDEGYVLVLRKVSCKVIKEEV